MWRTKGLHQLCVSHFQLCHTHWTCVWEQMRSQEALCPVTSPISLSASKTLPLSSDPSTKYHACFGMKNMWFNYACNVPNQQQNRKPLRSQDHHAQNTKAAASLSFGGSHPTDQLVCICKCSLAIPARNAWLSPLLPFQRQTKITTCTYS